MLRPHIVLCAVIVGGVLANAAPAAQPPQLPQAVRQAMQDQQYGKAVEAIEAAIRANPKSADYLAYLKARALFFDGKLEEAVAMPPHERGDATTDDDGR